jgi:hypothetical protein
MSSSGVTSLNQLPSLNNQNGHIQQQMMMQQPQNVVLNRSEIVSTNNNQMTTSNYNQLIPTSGTYSSNPITQNNNLTMENQNQNLVLLLKALEVAHCLLRNWDNCLLPRLDHMCVRVAERSAVL